MRAAQAPHTRAEFRAAAGALLVLREPPPAAPPAPGQPPTVPGNAAEGLEVLLAVWDDGSATALCGKVDLGTGIRTALGQLVAEELELPYEQVHVLLGDTARAPNQGPTIASATLQLASAPLRLAAAQARLWLLAEAKRLGLRAERAHEVLAGRHVELTLDSTVMLKPSSAWRVAGQDAPRVDLPAKVLGEPAFVHDVRVQGMVHGRVVRPPYAGADHGAFIGHTLREVDEASVAHIAGLLAVVVSGDFVGVVAEREEQAERAMRELRVSWADWPAQPPLQDLAQALSANPATPRVVADMGDATAANASAPTQLRRRYVWPYQMHASIGPSCAVAQWWDEAKGDGVAEPGQPRLRVWAGTQAPHVLRADLALLLDLAEVQVDVVRLEAAGCYGRNGADDVAADAALLARAVGRPVRVQLTREQEHQWEPKGAAQLMDVSGSLDAQGALHGWDFSTCYPSNAAPTLALLLTGKVQATAQAYAMGDRTSVPPYRVPNLRVTVNDMPPILRASWLRGVSALPNSFAHECFIDELAQAQGADPLAFRLQHLDDVRARELLAATAARAGYVPHTQARLQEPTPGVLKGQGVAYARYTHSKFPGFGAAWSAWVADVEVNRATGEVHVNRVVVGHDAGAMVNPAGVRHQVHGNVVQTTSRALQERVAIEPERGVVASREWGSYPILSFREVPVIEVVMMPRPGEPMLGAGESSSVPGTAAIANAIFDATGVRFREPPFTPEVVRAALNPLPPPSSEDAGARAKASQQTPQPIRTAFAPSDTHAQGSTAVPAPRRKAWWARGVALAGALITTTLGLMGWRAGIAPVTRPDATIYTAATIERGRQLAALGNCAGCHTAPGGAPNAGGRALETPFGTIVSTNLTPDEATGIGRWSFSAFQRAMREGISRDGRHLYPAFPYTAFTRLADDELMALYAYLMAQPAVANEVADGSLRWPFNLRPLMALWNALHLQTGPREAAAPAPSHQASAQIQASLNTALWQRGHALVNGVGHCGACHTERNALGAEKTGSAYLAGAMVEGWLAPPLTATLRGGLPWSEAALFSYLRHGYSAMHGVAVGPMAQVVTALAQANEADVHAMAHYLASLQQAPEAAELQRLADSTIRQARAVASAPDAMQRFFDSACGACHNEAAHTSVSGGTAAVDLGLNLPLALNTKLHAATPDNLLQVLLHGIQQPATRDIAFMPAFGHALSNTQLAELAVWLRRRFAPAQPGWGTVGDLRATVARLRATSGPGHGGTPAAAATNAADVSR